MSVDALPGRAGSLVSAVWKAVNARVPRIGHPVTGYLLVLMIVGGIVLRLQNIGYPFQYGFDEEQMVTAARQFLIGVPDTGECCHPPLSKLLVGVSILMFGDNPVAWRYPALCFGLQSIVLVFLIGRSLFKDSRAGWLAAAFMAADGFNIAFSRDAFTEGMITCLVLWSMLAAITARGWAGVLTCAVLVGLAGSVKWSGFAVGLPACVAILMLRRVPWYSLVSFAVVPFVHLAIWMIGLYLIGHPNDPVSVWEEMRRRQDLHLGFVHGVNPLESAWYTWLVMYHPIVLKSVHAGNRVRLSSSVANLVLFVAADLCLFALPVVAGVVATSARWRRRWSEWFDADFSRALVILGVSWVSMMLLWFTGRITSYWYHYLTPWAFAILLVAGIVARLDQRFPKEVLTFVALMLAVSVYFAPIWAELPISTSGAYYRLLAPRWR
jgi:dolichyl-phosphate-mannose--protein O-mannosyl transferase